MARVSVSSLMAHVAVAVAFFTLGVFLSSSLLSTIEREREKKERIYVADEVYDVAGMDDVVLNEFVPYPSEGDAWVELFNVRDVPLSLEGYYIELSVDGRMYPTPLTGIIAPRGYKVVFLSLSPLSLSTEGGQVLFVDPSRESVLDALTYGTSIDVPVGWAYFRDPAGGMWSETLTDEPVMGGEVPVTRTSWSGAFEVHVFNVGQGDSQFIIFPSGYSILIDIREEYWQDSKGAKEVAARIRRITGSSHVNVGVISHLHLDHLGYAFSGGFWYLLEKEGITFDKIVDRDAGVYVDYNSDGKCDPNADVEWHNAGTFSGTATKWICYSTDPRNRKIFPYREIAQLCSDSQINPPDEGASVTIVTVDGIGAYMKDGKTPISGNYVSMSYPPSENDYSVGLLIRYKDIEYVTCGDLDGDYSSSSFGYTYNDIEKVVANRVGEIDVYHLNHHGSSHSSSSYWVSTLKPTVSIGSCGVDNSYGHPDQEVIDRITSTGALYLTTDCDRSHNYRTAVRANSDVVLSSTDGSAYSITANAHTLWYFAKPKNEKEKPKCP